MGGSSTGTTVPCHPELAKLEARFVLVGEEAETPGEKFIQLVVENSVEGGKLDKESDDEAFTTNMETILSARKKTEATESATPGQGGISDCYTA